MMVEYLKHMADRILGRFDCEAMYPGKRTSISDTMEQIGTEVKSSFFETKPHVYLKSGVGDDTKGTFSITADF